MTQIRASMQQKFKQKKIEDALKFRSTNVAQIRMYQMIQMCQMIRKYQMMNHKLKRMLLKIKVI